MKDNSLPHCRLQELLERLEDLRSTLVCLVEQGRDLDDQLVLDASHQVDQLVNEAMNICPRPAAKLLQP